MLAAYAKSQSADDPLSGLEVGERPDPQPRDGWTTVRVKAAGLNHHDLFSLQGVGLPADRLPMVLGCDGAGLDEDGNEVIVHAVVPSEGWRGDETLDPKRTLLSELHHGTLAEQVLVPRANLVPKPESLSWEHAACLSTAWLTAYRMLFVNAGVTPGATVLVQGAGGGVATALVQLGSAAGLRMWVTSRDEAKLLGLVSRIQGTAHGTEPSSTGRSRSRAASSRPIAAGPHACMTSTSPVPLSRACAHSATVRAWARMPSAAAAPCSRAAANASIGRPSR